MTKRQRDAGGAAFAAILNQYMQETGARKGPDGALVYPPGVREKLESGELKPSCKPIAGEQASSDLKLATLSQVLLTLLVAAVAAIVALAQ